MEALTPPLLLQASERPGLVPGQPRIWCCRAQGQAQRPLARLLLREILAFYLRLPPGQVPLAFESARAPSVGADWQGMELSISLSYARDVALIALCPDAGIGVDIAEIVPMPDWRAVARLYLGPEAESRLAWEAPGLRDRAFAQAWAEMEARSKCLGLGLEEWTRERAAQLQAPPMELASLDLGAVGTGIAHAVAVARMPPARLVTKAAADPSDVLPLP